MNIVHRGSYIDASYQDSVHLAEGFQRRRLKCEKFTDERRQRQGELKKIRVITKLPNSEQSYKGKVKTHNYINR